MGLIIKYCVMVIIILQGAPTEMILEQQQYVYSILYTV